MSTGSQMDKKVVVYIHNGISANEKKGIWVSSNEVDETGAYFRVKSVRKKNTNIVY